MNIVKQPTVRFVWRTPQPLRVIAVAARMTYSRAPIENLMKNITDEEMTRSVAAILERGHWSVLRHVSFCFTVSGVSRALSHQLVRHTVGHSFEQRSQHYRDERNPSFVEPPTLSGNGYYEGGVVTAGVLYDTLLSQGVPREDARMVLPNGVETQLIWTANLEALMNFTRVRACRVNCSEIISVAAQVRRIIVADIPEVSRYLGPTCYTRGVCYEGKKYHTHCLKPWRSPTVLWSPEFPARIELVGVDGAGSVIMASASGKVTKEDSDG
jgi:thymidylate synthase (FAD)